MVMERGGRVMIFIMDVGRRSIAAGALLSLALLAGCATRSKLPPGVHPSVEVGPPLKSEAWKAVATADDQDRIARLGLAWEGALADARRRPTRRRSLAK